MDEFRLLPDFTSEGSVVSYFAAIFAQIIIFLGLFTVLKYFIFKPLINIFAFRKRQIDEVEKKTAELRKKNSVMAEEYQWRMEGAMQLAEEKREIAKLIGKKRLEMIISDTKRETMKDLDNLEKNMDDFYKAVLPSLKEKIADFGDEIAEKILGE